MGGFWSNLMGKLFPSKPIKIFMGGLDAAGKTTILYKLKLGIKQPPIVSIPTVDFNVEQIKLNSSVTIVLWDVGGGFAIKRMLHHYYEDVEAYVYIVDCHDPQRIQQVKKQLDFNMFQQKLSKAIVLILANKQDLAETTKNFMTNQFLINKLELHRLTEQKRPWNVMKCSGFTGQGLKQAMDWLSIKLIQKKRTKAIEK